MAVVGESLFTPRKILTKNPSISSKNPLFGAQLCFPSNHDTRVRSALQVELGEAEVLMKTSLGFDVVAKEELKHKGVMGMRKTKMVCTIGPACSSLEDLKRLGNRGMNVARLNICHNTREWHKEVIWNIKKLNEENGFCILVVIDTEGSQMHMVDHGAASSVKAGDGSIWLFTTESYEGVRPFTVQANYEGFSEGIEVGDEVVIDGGMASFEVIEKVGNDLRCKCTDPGLLLPLAKLSFWRDGKLVDKNFGLPTLLAKSSRIICRTGLILIFGISEGVDFIAVSFVKVLDDIKLLKDYLTTKSFIRVLAKVESLESLKNLEDIVDVSDGIMIARGDLGVQIPLEHIPNVQEEITDICRQLNKPVIVASQLLESMIEYPIPTRAEVADISEAVRQYADALMLSGESAIGSFGDQALSVLGMVSGRMELWSREENQQGLLSHLSLEYLCLTALPSRFATALWRWLIILALIHYLFTRDMGTWHPLYHTTLQVELSEDMDFPSKNPLI